MLSKSGAFFSYDGERLGQGRANVKTYLKEHPAIAADIEGKIFASLGMSREPLRPVEAEGASNGSAPPQGDQAANGAIAQAA